MKKLPGTLSASHAWLGDGDGMLSHDGIDYRFFDAGEYVDGGLLCVARRGRGKRVVVCKAASEQLASDPVFGNLGLYKRGGLRSPFALVAEKDAAVLPHDVAYAMRMHYMNEWSTSAAKYFETGDLDSLGLKAAAGRPVNPASKPR